MSKLFDKKEISPRF